MKYERLTNNEYNAEYDFCCDCKYYGEPNGCNRENGECVNYERFMDIYDRLAELEDKIDDGTLMEHKVKFNDVVYVPIVDCDIKDVFEMRVQVVQYGVVIGVCGTINGIGKFVTEIDNVFLTKEEAEAKLKELEVEE